MKTWKSVVTVLGFLCVTFFANERTSAQWSTDPSVNSPICTSANNQFNQSNNQLRPTTISDGNGGAIFTWQDSRNGVSDIYAQRINANGVVQWLPNGVPICTASAAQTNPTLVSDDSGGAIITWSDPRNGNSDIYAQRIDSAGVIQWLSDGVVISAATSFQVYSSIVGDGVGGALITWVDSRSGIRYDIYAQRVNAGGLVRWAANGIPVSVTAGAVLKFPTIASDGIDGAIICWEDYRSPSGNSDLYAQRVDTSGAIRWTPNGVAVCSAANDQGSMENEFPVIIGDGYGGAIMAWQDDRVSAGGYDIYTQRIDSNGVTRWAADGVAIATGIQNQRSPTLVSDGAGGAIITWYDNIGGIPDIYAQRVDSGGTVQWTPNGAPICTAASSQDFPTIVSDGIGGAIISWEDSRGSIDDIYAQRINGSGLVQWMSNGVFISSATDHQDLPTLVSDGNHGAIITWEDRRTNATTATDIYAQQVNANGSIGVVTGIGEDLGTVSGFALSQNYPNPFNPSTAIRFSIAEAGFVSLTVHNVLGQRVATLVNEAKQPGTYTVTLDSKGLPSGMYLYRLHVGSFFETKKLVLLR